MKVRLHHDSLRLRVSPADVARLRDTGVVEAVTHFPGAVLRCVLREDASAGRIGAELRGASIVVTVPQRMGRPWAEGEQVGISGEVMVEGGAVLRILIEKDFECMHEGERGGEVLYPNPNERGRGM